MRCRFTRGSVALPAIVLMLGLLGAACGGSTDRQDPGAATVPEPPTNVMASAGNALANVSWTAPANDGGSTITSYTVTSSPGGITATVSAPSTGATVTGLTNGTSYTFTVVATNSAGNSASSSPSNAVTPTPPANIVFVTSTTYQPGALGGLSGADSACQARAAAAGLPGTYKAWLSTNGADGVNAISRLGSARGWRRPDGRPFVDTTTDLANGKIMYPPRLDESGNDLGTVVVVTNTDQDGRLDASVTTCNNYTDTNVAGFVVLGHASAGSSMFTAVFATTGCSTSFHLYCFGIDNAVAVSPVPTAGRRAFVTNGSFTVGGGLAAADALCASEASAAGLTGTFLAALATTSASVQSRFDTAGAPWVRADGLALAPTAAALFTSPYLEVAFNQNAGGTVSFDEYGVWSGASSWSLAGTSASTCANYTSTTGTGIGGIADDTNVSLLANGTAVPCSANWAHLVCMQQ